MTARCATTITSVSHRSASGRPAMLRRFAALALTCTALVAQAGVTIQHWVAPSGARVYFVENHDLPIVDAQVDFAAGSLYAPAGKTGLAGLTNGLIDNGAGELNEEQVAERLVDLGAQTGSNVDTDKAGFNLRTLSSKKERDGALALMRTILAQPRYPQEVIDREKARSIAALREADTRPDSIVAKKFAAATYGEHPYGRTATPETITAITRDDVVAFHRARYTAGNAVVSLVGDLSRTEAEAIAQQLTQDLPAGAADTTPPPITPPRAQVLRIAHPAAQSHILIGLPALARDDADYFPLIVGNYTLGGGGFVSRLMNEVREKRGLVYDVHSYFQARLQAGPFQIGLQTRRDQADEALKVANDVLAGFLKSGPSEAELKAAKQNIADGLALRIDSNAKLLANVANIGFYKLPLTYLDDYVAKVNAVSAKQVRDAFQRKVKPENLVTVVVAGDEKTANP